jgi:bleomycin hydrolase
MAGTFAGASDTALTLDALSGYELAFRADPKNLAAMNAVTSAPLSKVAVDRDVAATIDHSFSHHLPENKATAQNQSGRCWLFAALNTFRVNAIKSMNLPDDWELSQAYLCFYDKLEKANYFLTNILDTLDEPVGSRVLDHLLLDPIQDGGQWHMFINLVNKYGVVPKSAMPETDSSSCTGPMNAQVTGRLREFAWRLRSAHANGSTMEQLDQLRREQMAQVYSMLCVHLGVPPTDFEWQWRDKDRNFTRSGRVTPQAFFKQFVGMELSDLVCLIHDPRPGHSFNRLYTIKYLGNVVGGAPIAYVNVDLDTMKAAAIKQISDGEPAWFGCDVGKYLHRELGTMDMEVFAYDLLYGSDLELPKAERLMYRQSMMTHAMVFTGVDLDESGRAKKWRVENSWGEEGGQKGFYQMSDRWFDEYNLEVVVHKRHLAPEVVDVLSQDPVVLDPWDPMGSLAV